MELQQIESAMLLALNYLIMPIDIEARMARDAIREALPVCVKLQREARRLAPDSVDSALTKSDDASVKSEQCSCNLSKGLCLIHGDIEAAHRKLLAVITNGSSEAASVKPEPWEPRSVEDGGGLRYCEIYCGGKKILTVPHFVIGQSVCDAHNATLEELSAWKESALTVLNGIALQEIGKELNLSLGQDIGPMILPAIKALKQRGWSAANADYVQALRQTIAYCKQEEGRSQLGYFSCGWAGQQLSALADELSHTYSE